MQLSFELSPPLRGAAAGAIVPAMLGFTWGGWMTTSAANSLVEKQTEIAVAGALAPICAENSQRQTGALHVQTAPTREAWL